MKIIRIYTLLSGCFLLQVLLNSIYAQCPTGVALSATATYANSCVTTGSITINVTGTNRTTLTMDNTNGPVFRIKLGSTTIVDWAQLPIIGGDIYSRVYTGVTAGTYTIEMQAFNIPPSGPPTICTLSTTATMTQGYTNFTSAVVVNRKSMTCQNTGRINLTLQNGRTPYRVEVLTYPTGFPSSKANYTTSLTNSALDSIPGGIYSIRVTDSCGATYTYNFTALQTTLTNDLPQTSNAATNSYMELGTNLQATTTSACNTAIPNANPSYGSDWSYYINNGFYEYAYAIGGTVGTYQTLTNLRPEVTLLSNYYAFCSSPSTIASYIRVKACPSQVSPGRTHDISTYLCKTDAFVIIKTYISAVHCDSVKLGAELDNMVGMCYPLTFQVRDVATNTIIFTETPIAHPRTVLSNPNSQPTYTASKKNYRRGRSYELIVTDKDGRVFTAPWNPVANQLYLGKIDATNKPNGYACTPNLGTRTIFIYMDEEDRWVPGTTVKYVSGPQPLAMGDTGSSVTITGLTNTFYPNGALDKIMLPGTYVFELSSSHECTDKTTRLFQYRLDPYYHIDTTGFAIVKSLSCGALAVRVQGVTLSLIDSNGNASPLPTYYGLSVQPVDNGVNNRARVGTNDSLLLRLSGRYTISIYASSSGGCIMVSLPSFDVELSQERLYIDPYETSRYICEEKSIGNIYVTAKNGMPNPTVYPPSGYQFTITYAGKDPNIPANVLAQNNTGEFPNFGLRDSIYDIIVKDNCPNPPFVMKNVTMFDLTNANLAHATNDLGFCEGGNIYLYCLSLGNKRDYYWTGPNNFTDTTQFPVVQAIKGLTDGWYTVNVLAKGCDNPKQDSIYVDVLYQSTTPLTVNSPVNVCKSSTSSSTVNVVVLSGARPADGHTLQWYDREGLPIPPPVAVSNYISGSYTGLQVIYYVSQTNGVCESDRVQVVLNVIANCSTSGITVNMSQNAICLDNYNPSSLPTLSVTGTVFGPILWGGFAQGLATVTIPLTTATNTNGTLAVRFESDGSGVRKGINAIISCTGSSSFCGTIYRIPSSGNMTINTCCGILENTLDENNEFYTNNANGYIIINPNISGAKVSIEGSAIVEANWDFFTIYDGVYTLTGSTPLSQVLQAGYWVSNNPSVAIVVNGNQIKPVGEGSVTFSFISGNGPVTTATFTVRSTKVKIWYDRSTYCVTEPAQTIKREGATGGTWSISPASSGFNSSNGTITPSAMTPNTYTVRCTIPAQTGTGACPQYIDSTKVTITTGPSITAFNYGDTTFCGNNSTPVIPYLTGTGHAGGRFSATPSGLAIDTVTGIIIPNQSTLNVRYTITYTSPVTPCGTATAQTALTIHSVPLTPIVMNNDEELICDGELINRELLLPRNSRIYAPNIKLEFFMNEECTINFADFTADYRTVTSYTIYVRAKDTITKCVSAAVPIIINLKNCNVVFAGTVVPFIYHEITGTENQYDLKTKEFLNSAFPVIAALYVIPDYTTTSDPIAAIALATPLFVDTAVLYNGSPWYGGIPKYPGNILHSNNPGVEIYWDELIVRPQGLFVDNTALGDGETPETPIGIYAFVDVPDGKYLLVLSRIGYVTRYAEVTIDNEGGYFGHRELIMGDINKDGKVDDNDMNEILLHYGVYISPVYDPKYDVTSNGRIDTWDVLSVKAHLGFNKRHYSDTRAWLLKYGN